MENKITNNKSSKGIVNFFASIKAGTNGNKNCITCNHCGYYLGLLTTKGQFKMSNIRHMLSALIGY